MRKRVLIIFPYGHLAFSPQTINLYDSLTAQFDVSILALEPFYFSSQRLEHRDVIYVRMPRLLRRICGKLDTFFTRIGRRPLLINGLTALLLLRAARRQKCDESIAVDFLAGWVAQRAFGETHLLSLEIYDYDSFRDRVDVSRLRSIIIQSSERYHHLFPNGGPRFFAVQNAPVYRPLAETGRPHRGLVFCGTAVPEFGIYQCLDFIARYPEFHLTIKGAIPAPFRKQIEQRYRAQLAAGSVTIDDTYVERAELAEYLSQFSIGFCWYDLELLRINRFNYLTAPSGKLFNYYSGGVPVIAPDMPGLSSVREFETGVLTKTFTPEAIRDAVEIISRDQARFRTNCLRAAQHFSFDKAVRPFCDFLLDLPPRKSPSR